MGTGRGRGKDRGDNQIPNEKKPFASPPNRKSGKHILNNPPVPQAWSVITKAPGAESRMNKLFGHVETAIQRLFSFAGTRGDPARTGGYRLG
jgi:hypothetical protein